MYKQANLRIMCNLLNIHSQMEKKAVTMNDIWTRAQEILGSRPVRDIATGGAAGGTLAGLIAAYNNKPILPAVGKGAATGAAAGGLYTAGVHEPQIQQAIGDAAGKIKDTAKEQWDKLRNTEIG